MSKTSWNQSILYIDSNTLLTVLYLLDDNIAELYTVTSNNSTKLATCFIGTFNQQLFISKTVSNRKHLPILTHLQSRGMSSHSSLDWKLEIGYDNWIKTIFIVGCN